MKLSDFAANTYSQFGEDGIIAHIFEKIAEINPQTGKKSNPKLCVEFGAADGLTCSNTAKLWRDGQDWKALLIEADPTVYAQLVKNTQGATNVLTQNAYVEANGSKGIDTWLSTFAYTIDFMSIDVDGGDYAIFEGMVSKPRVISIEYNQSIPSHMSLRQETRGDCFGASALALYELAKKKGYEFIGLTKANLFFVEHNDFGPFVEYERNLDVLFPHEDLTYLITDYAGRSALVGAPSPPWGLLDIPYLMETVGVSKTLSPATSEQLKAAWEERYGAALFIPANWSFNMAVPNKAFEHILRSRTNLIIVEMPQVSAEDCIWIEFLAEKENYAIKKSGELMILIRKDLLTRPVLEEHNQ